MSHGSFEPKEPRQPRGFQAAVLVLMAACFPIFALMLATAYWKNIHPVTGILAAFILGYSGYIFYTHLREIVREQRPDYKKIFQAVVVVAGFVLLFNPLFELSESRKQDQETQAAHNLILRIIRD